MIKLGVVGVGTIATAVIKGLKAKYADELEVYLSPRNAARAEALRSAYPGVRVMASNQEVVDTAEWVILSVLPSAAEDTAKSLRFTANHRVISLVSRPKMADLASWIGEVRSLCRVIPQTFIENRIGPILLYPPLPEAKELFEGLGQVVATETEKAFDLAQTLTCVMGPFMYLLDQLVLWMKSCGLPPEQSAAFLEAMFPAMTDYAARTDPNHLDELWKEVTPGGLNEMAIRMIKEDGGYAAWIRAMDAVREKLA